jgi:2-amino-4-hydroxy-6-hydroxymethyldihydropteridine diphosphokinase
MVVPVAVSLGSNLGDRRAHLQWATDWLGNLLKNARASEIIETEPFGVSEPQPPYLNSALVGETERTAAELVTLLLDLERRRGRVRVGPRAARTLDLDLVLYGDAIIDEPGLVVPHPRFRERLFVLEPLASIAAGVRDPVTGMTVDELLKSLQANAKNKGRVTRKEPRAL